MLHVTAMAHRGEVMEVWVSSEKDQRRRKAETDGTLRFNA